MQRCRKAAVHKQTKRFLLSAFCISAFLHAPAYAAPAQCLALYGECKYAPGFAHFEYVNPAAPKGGAVKLAESGTFDSLNPFILKGVKAPAIAGLFESLMVQSLDEAEVYYGLVAESVDVAPDRSTAEFTLRAQAKWQDGQPITPEDVVYSYETLKEKGDPTYRILFAPITRVEKTGARTVRFTFAQKENREAPLIAAQLPILPKHYYADHDFEKTTLEPPLGSGPYRVGTVDPGRSITFERVKDYWGEKLAVNAGQNNFDSLRYDMYRDENVTLEALKAGEYDFRQEYIARNWATAYDSPAVKDGRLVKRVIPHDIPQGMQAFVFNTRQPRFADRRVREAIDLTLDFAWMNKTIFYSAYQRDESFFGNTPFAASGVPQGRELALLAPFREQLPPGLFSAPFQMPVTDGSGNARGNLIKAQKLLEEAGWVVKDGKRVNAQTGEKLTIEFMLHQPTMERVVGPMRRNLERLGIESAIRRVDDAQYQKRVDSRDFDVISIWINRGVFYPGNEQAAMWQSDQADIKGSNNLSGAKNPAVDAALAQLAKARDLETLTAAGRALDRVLLWEHYVIPHWRSQGFRIAYWDKFGMPQVTPKYSLGFQTWWMKQ